MNFDLDRFRPLNGWMIVRMDPESKTTESGLIIRPDGAREHLYRRGTILRTSHAWVQVTRTPYAGAKPEETGKWRKLPCPFPVGTRVLFPFFYGERVFERFRAAIGDKNVVLMKPEDILLYDEVDGDGLGIDDITLSVTAEGTAALQASPQLEG